MQRTCFYQLTGALAEDTKTSQICAGNGVWCCVVRGRGCRPYGKTYTRRVCGKVLRVFRTGVAGVKSGRGVRYLGRGSDSSIIVESLIPAVTPQVPITTRFGGRVLTQMDYSTGLLKNLTEKEALLVGDSRSIMHTTSH